MGKMADYINERLLVMRSTYTQGSYLTQFSDMYCSMFAWGAPDFFDQDWAERFLQFDGNFVGGFLPDGRPAIAPNVSRGGQLDIYGDGTQANAPCRGTAGTITGTIGVDAFICYNNAMRMPEIDLDYYPTTLSRIDKAVFMLSDYAKYPPFICVPNSVIQTAINSKLDEADQGAPRAIVDDGLIDALTRGGKQGVYSVEITDPDKIKLVQYLLEAHDVLIRRILAKNGIDTRRTSKHAQVSVDEADGMQLASWVYPMSKLRARQKFAQQWSARYPDYPITVDFAEPWKSAYAEFIAEQELIEVQVEAAEQPAEPSDGGDKNDPE